MVVEKTIGRVEPAKVAVLMATYNGAPWVLEQVNSILGQERVELTLYVSDDCSTDQTWRILTDISAKDSRVILLPNNQKFGNAGKNFFRLITEIDVDNFDYIAFADQDDIWVLDKLASHINLIKKMSVDAVSSNVTAFWENGKKRLINKSQPVRSLDYLFEAAGPGCTYLMTSRLAGKVKQILITPGYGVQDVELHDWLSYAVCRANDWNWHIDQQPTVMYRQHPTNLLGANAGFRAKFSRFKKLKEGWYRHQVLLILRVCSLLKMKPEYEKIELCLTGSNYWKQLCILKFISDARRKFSDRVMFGMAILLGIF